MRRLLKQMQQVTDTKITTTPSLNIQWFTIDHIPKGTVQRHLQENNRKFTTWLITGLN